MINNAHCIDYYFNGANNAKQNNRWLAYEFWRDWFNNELRRGSE